MGNKSIPYCNDLSIPDYKLCYMKDFDGGYCSYPFLDVFVRMLNASDDTLVIRNQAFRENYSDEIFRNAARHTSGKRGIVLTVIMFQNKLKSIC